MTKNIAKIPLKNLKKIPHSQTLWINELCDTLKAQGRDIIKFGFGESPFSPPDWVTNTLVKHSNDTRYLPVQGLKTLQEACKKFHHYFQDLDLSEHETFIAPGSKLLLYACQAAFQKASILIPAPAWVSYHPQAELCGHESIIIHCNAQERWRVTPKKLEEACKKAQHPPLLILNYPGNPDGLSYSQDELDALASVAKKYHVLVIADEIYNLLDHHHQHPSIAKAYPEGSIITTGLSKCCGAGGWRLGIAFVPKALGQDFLHTLKGIASETYSCTSSPIQQAAITAYQNPEKLNSYFKQQQKILNGLGTYIAEELNNNDIQTHPPQGGFYVYPDFTSYKALFQKHGIHDSNTLCQRLLQETGVALLPGSAFNQDPTIMTCRLAYVDFDGDHCLNLFQNKKSISQKELLKACPKIKIGINRIQSWLKTLKSN
ncbi:MAG: aminotransferase class I/II-fold pyridoxal phosphate-dependent enzyme [bacterium]